MAFCCSQGRRTSQEDDRWRRETLVLGCPKHKAWGRHQPQKCEGKGFIPGKQGKPKNEHKAQDKSKKDLLTVTKALTAFMEADAEDDEE